MSFAETMQTKRKFEGIHVGDTFTCYEDLRVTIESVQEESEVLLYMRDSVTLKGAVKKRPRVASMANPDLLYHSIQYVCVFGRRATHKTTGFKKLVPELFTPNNEKCKSEIKVGLSDDFQRLEVRKIIDVHNHAVTRKIYNTMAEHRSFHPCTPRYRSEYESQGAIQKSPNESRSRRPHRNMNYSELGSGGTKGSSNDIKPRKKSSPVKRKREKTVQSLTRPRKKIRQEIQQSYSNGFVSKSVTKNSRRKNIMFGKRLGFKNLVEELYQVNDASVEVLEIGLKPKAIYFQTLEMRNSFAAYPELIVIDASCKISQLNITVYVVMSADGDGKCMIVCLWFVVEESSDSIIYLIEQFKHFNSDWEQIRVVLSDKELCQRNFLMSQIPEAFTFISYFHVVGHFSKEIFSVKDYGFESEDERNTCFGILKKMTLAKNEEIYHFHFDRLKLYSPKSFFNYFLYNWDRVQDQWVDGFKNPFAYFINQRSNRLEAINQIISSVCNNFKDVSSFSRDLMKSIASLQLERKQGALGVPVKGPVITSEFHIAEMQYKNLLTPYAFDFVKRQLHLSRKVKIQDSISNEMSSIKSLKYGELVTSITSCPCIFFTVTSLPCSHVFAVRRDKGMPTYDVTLCEERWTMQYLRRTHNLPDEETGLIPDALFGYGETPPTTPQTDDFNGDTLRTPSEADEAPFIPSCGSSSVDAENLPFDQNLDGIEQRSDNEIVIDTNDPTSDEMQKSAIEKLDLSPNLDWIALQETL